MINQYLLQLIGQISRLRISHHTTSTPQTVRSPTETIEKNAVMTASLTNDLTENRIPNQPDIRKKRFTPYMNIGSSMQNMLLGTALLKLCTRKWPQSIIDIATILSSSMFESRVRALSGITALITPRPKLRNENSIRRQINKYNTGDKASHTPYPLASYP